MTDTTYPSSTKPIAAAAPPILNQPPSKTQPHNPTRHPYHQNPPTRRRYKARKLNCRRCFCLTCFWSILLIIAIAAATGGAFYVVYNPHRPAFSVTALKISSFNLTTVLSDDTTHLTTNLTLTLNAKNPNKKITFFYEHISINVRSSSVSLANGDFKNFTNSPNTVFVIHTVMGLSSRVMDDPDDLNSLNTDLKRKNGLPVNIVVDTMVGVKLEKHKMKKVGIRVRCNGIRGKVPVGGKSVVPAVADASKAKCKVGLKIRIFRWTIFI